MSILVRLVVAAAFAVIALPIPVAAQEKLHFSYLWHLEQPVYWPDRRGEGPWRYERAWTSIQQKNGGQAHPLNELNEIFGKPDRVRAYQERPRDTVSAISWAPEAGAQVSFSGGLVENIQSFADAGGQLGYSTNWTAPWREARQWDSAGRGFTPRMDVVQFAFHHPLLPLCPDEVVRKDLALYAAVYPQVWGTSPTPSRGFFPSEMAFSPRLIPLLREAGIDWTFVSAEKLSRACADFPVQLGSGGVNCDPPNRADQVNPGGHDWFQVSISRGCGPAEALPFSFQPQRIGWVDPDTGAIETMVAVPCSQSLGWEDGYNPLSLGRFDEVESIAGGSDRPLLAIMAHDGDNAWGGGYSYYLEAVPNFVGQAQSAGYTATTVERYLADHPVPAGDWFHVEDGAWVNADGDFGDPRMLNWLDLPRTTAGQVDVVNGWSADARNWAVLIAGVNAVVHAEQISTDLGQPVRIDEVLHPDAGSTAAERAWHFLLGGFNSGYVYYGSALDLESKPGIAANEAWSEASALLDAGEDRTPPTIMPIQRHPWNPGGSNYGPAWGYQEVITDPIATIWTFVHDVSGLESVVLRYRLDADGLNPRDSVENETVAGGPGVGDWIEIPMAVGPFPSGNANGWADIDFLEPATAIASRCVATLPELPDTLVDYQVIARDVHGNESRSGIGHVWIGDGEGADGGGGDDPRLVELDPEVPVAGEPVLVRYKSGDGVLAGATSVLLHHGYDQWSTVVSPDRPLVFDAASGFWEVEILMPGDAVEFDFVFNDGAGTWDNNGGADWRVPIEGGEPGVDFEMDGVLDDEAVMVAEIAGRRLHAAILDDRLYVATEAAAEGHDVFILVADASGTLRPAPWAKSGQAMTWSAFLADEHDNGYSGWFGPDGSVPPTAPHANATGVVLEGVVELTNELGSVGEMLLLAAVPYASPDGGVLDPTGQAPATLNGDGTLDEFEFVRVDRCEITLGASCCPGDLDGDGFVGGGDLGVLLSAWGTGDPAADLDGDGMVGGADFGMLLAAFGACP